MAPTAIVPVPKKETDSVSDYIKYFSRVTKANKWTDEHAALMLGGCLEVGSSLLDDLDEDTMKSFEAIRNAVAPCEDSFREVDVQKFFTMQLKETETIEQFLGRCRNVVGSCYGKFAGANKEQLIP